MGGNMKKVFLALVLSLAVLATGCGAAESSGGAKGTKVVLNEVAHSIF